MLRSEFLLMNTLKCWNCFLRKQWWELYETEQRSFNRSTSGSIYFEMEISVWRRVMIAGAVFPPPPWRGNRSAGYSRGLLRHTDFDMLTTSPTLCLTYLRRPGHECVIPGRYPQPLNPTEAHSHFRISLKTI